MTLKVFHGVDVVVAEVQDDRIYSLLAIETDFDAVDFQDAKRRFPLDISMTPNRTKNLAKIQVDDRGIGANGKELPVETAFPLQSPLHITTIGSGSLDSPARGAFVGRVHIEHTRYMKYQPTCFASWPPAPVDLAQLTSIYRSDVDGAGNSLTTRYLGFIVRVDEVNGTKVQVTVKDRANKSFSFDTADTSVYLNNPPQEAFGKATSILSNLVKDKEGVLFIELKSAISSGLKGIKVPVGLQ